MNNIKIIKDFNNFLSQFRKDVHIIKRIEHISAYKNVSKEAEKSESKGKHIDKYA